VQHEIGCDSSLDQHDNKAAEKWSVTSQEQYKEIGHCQSRLGSRCHISSFPLIGLNMPSDISNSSFVVTHQQNDF